MTHKIILFMLLSIFMSSCSVYKSKLEKPLDFIEVTYPESSQYYYVLSQIKFNERHYIEAENYLKKAVDKDSDSVFLNIELSKIYLKNNKKELALATIQEVLKKKPDNLEALLIAARLTQIVLSEIDSIKYYENILIYYPDKTQVYQIIGKIYLQNNDYEKALDIYNKYIENYPDYHIGYYYKGITLKKMNDLTQSEFFLKKAIELDNSLNEARFEIIEIKRQTHKTNEIIKLYNEIISIDNLNYNARLNLLILYSTENKINEMEKILNELIISENSLNFTISALYKNFISQGELDDSLIILNLILNKIPNNSDLNYFSGLIYEERNEAEKALYHYNRVKTGSKFFHKSVLSIAILYQKTNSTVKSIEFIKRNLKEEPENLDFLYYLGSFYEDEGLYREAITTFEKGLLIEPDTVNFLYRLGIIHDKLNEKETAIILMKKVLDLEPDNSSALNYVGYTYAEMAINLREAEVLLKKATKLKPDDGYILDSLGWLYYKMNQLEKSIGLLQKAVDILPDESVILEHLGDAYYKLNKTEKALFYYNKSFENRKDDSETLQNKIKNLELNHE